MQGTTVLTPAQCDLRGLPLGALEAFVLSQVDGRLTLDEIAAIVGLELAAARRLAERLVELGCVRRPDVEARGERTPARSRTKAPPRGDPRAEVESVRPSRLDPRAEPRSMRPPKRPTRKSLKMTAAPNARPSEEPCDLDEGTLANITGFDQRLASDDLYAILGVEREAEKKAVKHAYFALASKFHPDRFFKKKLGHARPILERVFARITQAHDVLTDPARRQAYDASLPPRTVRSSKESASLRTSKAPPSSARPSKAPSKNPPSIRASKGPPASARPSKAPPGRTSKAPPSVRVSKAPPSARPSKAPPSARASKAPPATLRSSTVPPSGRPRPTSPPRASKKMKAVALPPPPLRVEAPNAAMQRAPSHAIAPPPVRETPRAQPLASTPAIAQAPRAQPLASTPAIAQAPRAQPLVSTPSIAQAPKPSASFVSRAEVKRRVDVFVQAGDAALKANDLIGAANNYRLALQNSNDPALRAKLDMVEEPARRRRFEISMPRARTAEREQRWPEAAVDYLRAHDAWPTAETAARAANALRMSSGDLVRAVTLAEYATAKEPRNASYRMILAEVLLASRLLERAATEAAAALAMAPTDPRATELVAAVKRQRR